MKKMNNKGFLLAESLVVSTFVLTVLVLLFVQFRGLFNSYEDSYAYNTVEGIYNLNTMKKYVLNNEDPDNTLANQIGSSGYKTIVSNGTCQTDTGLTGLIYCDELATAMGLQTLLYTSSNISSLNTSSNIFTQSFKDFLDRLENNDSGSRLIGQFKDGTYATIVFDSSTNSNVVSQDENIILYVSNSGNDDTGDGTLENPYATLSKAYEEANVNATIYIMNDITTDTTINFNQDKNITLTSYSSVIDRTNTIFRGSSLTSSILNVTGGSLVLDKINFDGNNVSATDSLVRTAVDTIIENGSTFRNGNNQSSYGGALYLTCVDDDNCGSLIINNATFTNNIGTYGGAIFTDYDTELIINGGTITQNTSTPGSGGGIYPRGTIEINGGTISSNTAYTYGGGLMCKDACTMSGGEITNNTATTQHGGGVRIDGTFTMSGGTISGNSASVDGAAICKSSGGTYNKTGGTVSGTVTQH